MFENVQMHLTEEGFIRPRLEPSDVAPLGAGDSDASRARRFKLVCPGVMQIAPPLDGQSSYRDNIMGRVAGVWEGWASDAAVRRAGSSGGVLTALLHHMLTGPGKKVSCVVADTEVPSRSVPVLLTDPRELMRVSGSRYAPVGACETLAERDLPDAFVGKPCEVSAARRLFDLWGVARPPLLLSFFCAGTPSQRGTEAALAELDVEPEAIESLRYRGDGCPGKFSVRTRDGEVRTMSYDESWGKYVGPTIQRRCKICVDGMGEDADISVGDYWETDARGFPLFDERDGTSVVIARTEKGADFLASASAQNSIRLRDGSLAHVRKIQPLQVERATTLLGRLVGARLAATRVPRYYGYSLLKRCRNSGNIRLARASAGFFVRSRRMRRERP